MSQYPMNYEEFEKKVIESYLKEYPEDRKELILNKLEGLLNDDVDFMKKLYAHICFRYNRGNPYDDSNGKLKDDDYFESLMVNTLQLYIGGNFDNTKEMSDLKKIEKNFHVLIKNFFLKEECIGDYNYQLPVLKEDLFAQEEFNRVPGMYGGFFYFLKLENEKPILYANASSRMDMDELYIIDETCYIWAKDCEYYKIFTENNIKEYISNI